MLDKGRHKCWLCKKEMDYAGEIDEDPAKRYVWICRDQKFCGFRVEVSQYPITKEGEIYVLR